MFTFSDLIASTEAEIALARSNSERALMTVRTIYAKAKQEARAGLSDAENDDVRKAMDQHERALKDETGAKKKLGDLKLAKAAEERADQQLAEVEDDPKAAPAKRGYDQQGRVGQEERTYHKGNCRKGSEFLRDVLASRHGNDIDASNRLSRHMAEERVERGQYLVERATGTGNFAGLTVPQYITEMYAPAVAARRPLADAMTKLDLPALGMTVNISRITTASSVALQAAENDAASETNMDDTLLTENVQTASGRQTISRQGVERGSGVEEVTMRDLQRRYATNIDSTIVSQATTGLAAVATSITYDDTSPTGLEVYPKLLAGMSASEEALLGQATPDLVAMHSRRWYWLQSQMTSTWPLVGQPGINAQQIGVNYAERYGAGFRGVLPNGSVVIVDNNISKILGAGTNQDEIYVVPSEESYLWEDPNAPQFIRSEEAKAENLGIVLVLYGYFAYTLRRYANSHQKITGTGLVTPSFA